MQSAQQKYMQRALQLALKGRFETAPNPMVGCVIVHQNKIIGEGFHQQFGEAHAEVNAIASVKNQNLLKESTLYVSLEPCAHHGKTPPCADLIIEKEIPHVVIASKDPFAKVNGKGVKKLEAAGIKVEQGILKEEADCLNRRFFTSHTKKRPYIILKWAETKDGFMGRNQDDPLASDSWITCPASKQLVHLWRAEESAILVGQNTAEIDNPALNCREVKGRNPLRIVLDQKLSLPKSLKVFDGSSPTLIVNEIKSEQSKNLEYLKLEFKDELLKDLLTELDKRGLQSLIVEGGAQTLTHFLNLGLWDEIRRFTGKKNFGQGIKAPHLAQSAERIESIGTDTLYYYYS